MSSNLSRTTLFALLLLPFFNLLMAQGGINSLSQDTICAGDTLRIFYTADADLTNGYPSDVKVGTTFASKIDSGVTSQPPGDHFVNIIVPQEIYPTKTLMVTLLDAGPSDWDDSQLTVEPHPAYFNYIADTVCGAGGTLLPDTTSGGAFSCPSLGNSLIQNGTILLASAPSGTAVIECYPLNSNSCSVSTTYSESIYIRKPSNNSVAYVEDTICAGSQDSLRLSSASSGGTFSAVSPGLQVDPNTGAASVGALAPGHYEVLHTLPADSCPHQRTLDFDILAIPSLTVNYPQNSFCKQEPGVLPIVNMMATFDFTPLGLSLDLNSGRILPGNSNQGTYTLTIVSDHRCPDTDTQTITITDPPQLQISYDNSWFCEDDPQVLVPTGTNGQNGTFTSPQSNQIVDNTTGSLDLTAGPGTYLITFTPSDQCYLPTSTLVEVVPRDAAQFSYDSAQYCQTHLQVGLQSPPGTSGGIFSSQASGHSGTMQIDSTSGTFYPVISDTGAYQISYKTQNRCPDSTQTQVEILAAPPLQVNNLPAMICKNGSSILPSSNLPAEYSSSPTGLIINTQTGEINPGQSTVGNYVVKIKAQPPCRDSLFIPVEIQAPLPVHISYGADTFCSDITSTLRPYVTDSLEGTFSCTQTNAIVDSIGTLDPTVGPGSYTIHFQPNDPCYTATDTTIQIVSRDNAFFAYANPSFCEDADTIQPLSPPASMGTYSGVTMPGNTGTLVIDPNTGMLPLGGTTPPGLYSVTYTTTGACTDSYAQIVEILPQPPFTTPYPLTPLCQNAPDILPTNTWADTFSTNSTGLNLDPLNGKISPQNSQAGTYPVEISTLGACSETHTLSIEITPSPITQVMFSDSSFCEDSTQTDSLLATDNISGNYTCINAPQIITSNGVLTLSPPGMHFIHFQPYDSCYPPVDTFIEIKPRHSAQFSYDSAAYCLQTPQVGLQIAPSTSGGCFTATPVSSNNDTLNINPNTGTLTLQDSSDVGTYTVTYTTMGRCSTSWSETVEIIGQPEIKIKYGSTDFPSRFCQNIGLVTPSSNSSGSTITWTLFPMLPSFQASDGSFNAGDSTGNFTLTARIQSASGACDAQDVVNFDIDTMKTVAFTNEDTTVCANGTPLQLRMSPSLTTVQFLTVSGTPDWVSVTGDSVGQFPTFQNLFDPSLQLHGTYRVVGQTAESHCRTRDTLAITVLPPIESQFNFSQPHYCRTPGDTLRAQGNSVGTGMFSGIKVSDGTSLNFLDPIQGVLLIASLPVGELKFTHQVQSGDCSEESTEIVQILDAPTPQLLISPFLDTVCEFTPIKLTSFSNMEDSLWLYDPGSGITDSVKLVERTSDNFEKTDLSPGLHPFILRASNLNGCEGFAYDTLYVNKRPEAVFVENRSTELFQSYSDGDVLTVNLETQAADMLMWSYLDMEDILLSENGIDSGTLSVRDSLSSVAFQGPSGLIYGGTGNPGAGQLLFETWGGNCPGDSLLLNFNLFATQEVFIPELVTPNGDGKNDTWNLRFKNPEKAPNYSLKLFDRSNREIPLDTPFGLEHPISVDDLIDGIYWFQLFHGKDLTEEGNLLIIRKAQ